MVRNKELYRSLLLSVMLRENVLEVVCNNTKEHYFDRIVVNSDGTISVYKYGLSKPFNSLCYDFEVDYAKLLFYLEEDLFLLNHGGSSIHGFVYSFKD